jgi:hypothetical protein
MMRKWNWILIWGSLTAAGCNSGDNDTETNDTDAVDDTDDTDDDSIDPDLDSDGDRLTDVQEATAGTDLNNPDTDGDGYLDGDEVTQGTDPLDPDSRIYTGSWPHWFDKDSLGATAGGTALAVGDVFPRVIEPDQYGDMVDLYDFGGAVQTHRYIVVALHAEWCPFCRESAEWIVGDADASVSWEVDHADIRAAVDDGTVAWIEVVSQDELGATVTPQAAIDWAADYDHPRIPVLADTNDWVETGIGQTNLPGCVVIDAVNMEVVTIAYLDVALKELALLLP